MEFALAPAAALAVLVGLGVELRLFTASRTPRRGEAILWSTGWLLLAVAVSVGIALAGGPSGEWTTVYLIERSLSLDHVFLFSLLLAYFLVPAELRGRVIISGIAGALLLRGVAIVGGLALVESAEAVVTRSASCFCTSPIAASATRTRRSPSSSPSSGSRSSPPTSSTSATSAPWPS